MMNIIIVIVYFQIINISGNKTKNNITTVYLPCALIRGTQRGYSSKPLNIALLNVF